MQEVQVSLDQALTLAEDKLRVGDAALAEDIARQVLVHAPGSLRAWLIRLNALLSVHRHAEALAIIGQALALAPGHAGLVRARVEILRALGRFDAALAEDGPGLDDLKAPILTHLADGRSWTVDQIRDALTILVPIAIDSPQRLRNVGAVLDFFGRTFPGIAVIVAEDSGAGLHLEGAGAGRPLDFTHMRVDHASPLFHKTWMLNRMAEAARTPLAAAWDGDCLATPEQIGIACRRLLDGRCQVAFPYGGAFVDVRGATAEALASGALEPDAVDPLAPDCVTVGMNAFGGAVLFDKAALAGIGGFNERIVSWGLEDREIIVRAQILGLDVDRAQGPLFHLHHPRGANSTESHGMWEANLDEFRRVEISPAEALRQDVAAGRFKAPLVGA